MEQTKRRNLTYAERAGSFLKAQLVQGRKAAENEEKKRYREKFAEKLGVDPRTLSRYCIAIHDVDTIAYIAEMLGVSVREMLFYEEEKILPLEGCSGHEYPKAA